MQYDVFISYRRKTASGWAELVKTKMVEYGYKEERIFMDTHSLRGGDFKNRITEAIEQSNNIVLLITENSFSDIKEKDYWVYEITKSVELHKNIVPVLFDGIQSMEELQIPESMQGLTLLNAVPYSHVYADASYERLLDFLVKENEPPKNSIVSLLKKTIEEKVPVITRTVKDKIPVIKQGVTDVGEQIAQTAKDTFRSLREKWKELTK